MNTAVLVLLAITGLPMLVLAVAGWMLARAFRLATATVCPRPIESDWDNLLATPPANQRVPAPPCNTWMSN